MTDTTDITTDDIDLDGIDPWAYGVYDGDRARLAAAVRREREQAAKLHAEASARRAALTSNLALAASAIGETLLAYRGAVQAQRWLSEVEEHNPDVGKLLAEVDGLLAGLARAGLLLRAAGALHAQDAAS